MLYLATASGPKVHDAMRAGLLGQMMQPNIGNRLLGEVTWAADNGCFSASWKPRKWLMFLGRCQASPLPPLFATVPDVVGDSEATDKLWDRWAPIVTSLGFIPAYVTQNGCRRIPKDAGAVFTGGDDEWKEGARARGLMQVGKNRGLWTHMGRVNTKRRLKLAHGHGYDSVDGTMLAFGPDKNLPILLRWMNELEMGHLDGC